MPLLSVVIPGYNRPTPLKATLRSVADAAARLPAGAVETILVDDGSTPPLAEQLAGFDAGLSIKYLRQANSGSIVARLHGLAHAAGEFVQFLDSDDLVHPEKFARQLAAQQAGGADISYCDVAEASPGPDHRAVDFRPTATLRAASAPAEVFLRVQPVPHSPIYRRGYLLTSLTAPLVPACRAMDPAGDIWLYYNLAARPARFVKVDGPFAAIGVHADERFSRHWEKLAIAALLVAEAFMAAPSTTVPSAPEASDSFTAARRVAGEVAFDSWRRLPWDFSPTFQRRLLAVWRRSPRGPVAALGGRGFAVLARALGPVSAAWMLRRLRGGRYAACATLPPGEFDRLLAAASSAS